MLKFIFATDWHFRGTNPRNRIDNYRQAVKDKLAEIFQLAKEKQVDAIISGGDTFDSFQVSIGTLLDLADFIAREKPKGIPILTTFGQHDVQGYNIDSYYRTSLALLERLLPDFHVFKKPSKPDYWTDNEGTKVQLTFTPYSRKVDVDGYGYSPEVPKSLQQDHTVSIHVTHGTLLDHEAPFDKFTLLDDVETTADLVLTGDYHPGYGTYWRQDSKIFCNPGSLVRKAATESNIERKIQVAYVEVKGQEIHTLDLIKLKNVKPGAEVLDRSKIEQEKQRQYAMEEFSALIEAEAGENVLLDINEIVERIGKLEEFEPEVVELALEKIDEQREEVVSRG